MTRRSFDSWLRAQQHREDPVGDLARDYLVDCRLRHLDAMRLVEVRASLEQHGSPRHVFDALDRAVGEWREANA